MSNVSIYIPGMKLDRIKLYCKENKISMSKLFSMGAMAIVNRAKFTKCDFCSKEAIGKFKVDYYDESLGMTSTEKYLCDYHKKEADKRSEVSVL